MLLNKIKILVLAGATGFNTSAAKELVTKYTDPFNDVYVMGCTNCWYYCCFDSRSEIYSTG